jgi:hypothetical protein
MSLKYTIRSYENVEAIVEEILSLVYTDKGRGHVTEMLGFTGSELWKAHGRPFDDELLRQCQLWVWEALAPLREALAPLTVGVTQCAVRTIKIEVTCPADLTQDFFETRNELEIPNTMNKRVVATQRGASLVLSFEHDIEPPQADEND